MERSIDLSTKEGLLLKSLMTFFEDKKNVDIMVPIVTESSPVSLRVLDWFITNYSRDHTKTIVKDELLLDFDVYNSYKAQLKAFNKKLFDPFCRLHGSGKIKKFRFRYGSDRFIMTTTGQLNFFKWAIENNIIAYVMRHYDTIKADLKQKESRKRSSTTSSEVFTTSTSSAADDDVLLSSPTPMSSSSICWMESANTRKNYVIRFD